MDKIDFIAKIRHLVWIGFQMGANQPFNAHINEDQLESLKDGVRFALENPNMTAEQNHDNWAKMKWKQGWVYGEVKDFEKKTHPDLISYNMLPLVEKRKDSMDKLINNLARELWVKLKIENE